MRISTPHLTARQAAELFAETAFEECRQVDPASFPRNDSASGIATTFRLVGGNQTYDVYPVPFEDGWEIVARVGVV